MAEIPRDQQSKPLDPSQRQAAEIMQGPLLLGAGPGTGKTKTLIGRCQFLTQTLNVPADNILALTFSRQAAREMRERLEMAGIGSTGARPWVGTFHSFGQEILRRYGHRLGLSTESPLLETLDCVTLLENHYSLLNLDALDNLHNPALHLGGIVKQISRAKDELCPPEQYVQLCAAMQAEAEKLAAEFALKPGKRLKKDSDAISRALTQAAKAREVAHCYQVYETLLRENSFLDIADLIYRAVTLLESCPEVLAEMQALYPHILADEYQDVNRASARLLKLLAGEEARGLWVVGDHRQSIYRFRGASPANVEQFSRDYPHGTRLELGANYRSYAPIVALFSTAASAMPGVGSWHADRGSESNSAFPAVTLATAPDEEGQADGIAQAIEKLMAAGYPFRDHAILCRTHGQAESLVAHLTERGVPTLYQGALLERPEVKDMLCLLALLAGNDSALLRVAAFPEYSVPQADTLEFLAQWDRENTSLAEALQSESLPYGLQRLGLHLVALSLHGDVPGEILRTYLHELSDYQRSLREQGNAALDQLRELAEKSHQRLVPLTGQSSEPPQKVRDFLATLRRMQSLGETLRETVPPESDKIDAVRILTAHGAKGLEFPVVYLPNLSAGEFPARGRHDGIPEPPGLSHEVDLADDEENCLFFVALSRARDHIILSRSETSGTDRALKPSPLLGLLEPWFTSQNISETLWPTGRTSGEITHSEHPPTEVLPTYTASALELYGRCPRQYYYERELKLSGAASPSGYPLFHHSVHETLRWWEDMRTSGTLTSCDALMEKLEEIWALNGPVGHRHETKYKETAQDMLQNAWGAHSEDAPFPNAPTLTLSLPSCHIRVRPDMLRLAASSEEVVIVRQLLSKPANDDKNDKRLALYRRAAEQTFPDRPQRLEIHYLSDGSMTVVDPPTTEYKAKLESERVAKYEAAARGIHLRQFPAQPGDICRTCAYALICPL